MFRKLKLIISSFFLITGGFSGLGDGADFDHKSTCGKINEKKMGGHNAYNL